MPDNPLASMLSALSKAPPTPSVAVPMCVCGKKAIALDEIRSFTTPAGVKAIDTTCKECLKDVSKFCKIVCYGCRKVVVVRSPEILPNGFEFARGGTQHVMGCPDCDNDLKLALQSGKQIPLLTIEQQLHNQKYDQKFQHLGGTTTS